MLIRAVSMLPWLLGKQNYTTPPGASGVTVHGGTRLRQTYVAMDPLAGRGYDEYALVQLATTLSHEFGHWQNGCSELTAYKLESKFLKNWKADLSLLDPDSALLPYIDYELDLVEQEIGRLGKSKT